MTPKNSDYSSDESQPSEMEVDKPCPGTGPRSPLQKMGIVSPSLSSENSLISPCSSSISPVSYCENHNPSKKRNQDNNSSTEQKQHSIVCSSQRKPRDESLSSISVPSSPEPTVSPHKDKEIRMGSYPRNFSCEELPRTAPCIVLSPSSNNNPHLFHPNFLNPSLYNPSSLIMPVMPFQMFHHHQSTIMSKMNNVLCSNKSVDLGMQRFRDFCTDHNFNAVANSFKSNGSISDQSANVIQKGSNRDENEKDDTHNRIEEKMAGTKRLSFGIDRILSDENRKSESTSDIKGTLQSSHKPSDEEFKDQISKKSLASPPVPNIRQPILYQNPPPPHHHLLNHPQNHNNNNLHELHHRHNNLSTPINSHTPLNLTNRCTECYLLGRYCRNNNGPNSNDLQYSSLVCSSNGATTNGVSASFSPWISNASIYENSPLLSPSAYHTQSTLNSAYNLGNANYSTMSSLVSCNTPGGRRKRSWSRAVFSSLQRKGLEKRFQIQKYITKPDRRQLAATLGLTDAQVKVWYQNRRMKWRHSKEGKVTSGVGDDGISVSTTVIASTNILAGGGPGAVSTSTPIETKT